MNHKGKTWCIGDIHGSHKALIQCLERSGFDKENDLLITLGDICDGWSEVYDVVEELLTIKNRIDIKGNHDNWFYHFLTLQSHPVGWQQGGLGTLKSYCDQLNRTYTERFNKGYITDLLDTDIPITHRGFFHNQVKYYKDDQNRLFIHGGFNRNYLLTEQDNTEFWWDRNLWYSAMSCRSSKTKLNIKEPLFEIFIGHTTTMNWKNTDTPMKADIITNLDTGAGFKGKLTIMNVNTHEYFQSDSVEQLYINEKGRN